MSANRVDDRDYSYLYTEEEIAVWPPSIRLWWSAYERCRSDLVDIGNHVDRLSNYEDRQLHAGILAWCLQVQPGVAMHRYKPFPIGGPGAAPGDLAQLGRDLYPRFQTLPAPMRHPRRYPEVVWRTYCEIVDYVLGFDPHPFPKDLMITSASARLRMAALKVPVPTPDCHPVADLHKIKILEHWGAGQGAEGKYAEAMGMGPYEVVHCAMQTGWNEPRAIEVLRAGGDWVDNQEEKSWTPIAHLIHQHLPPNRMIWDVHGTWVGLFRQYPVTFQPSLAIRTAEYNDWLQRSGHTDHLFDPILELQLAGEYVGPFV